MRGVRSLRSVALGSVPARVTSTRTIQRCLAARSQHAGPVLQVRIQSCFSHFGMADSDTQTGRDPPLARLKARPCRDFAWIWRPRWADSVPRGVRFSSAPAASTILHCMDVCSEHDVNQIHCSAFDCRRYGPDNRNYQVHNSKLTYLEYFYKTLLTDGDCNGNGEWRAAS